MVVEGSAQVIEYDGVRVRVIEWDGATYELRNRAVVPVFNQKGGVGKTTTTVNLGAVLAAHGIDTMVLDLDPQANTTTDLGVDPTSAALTMYEVLHPTAAKRVSIDDATVMVRPNLRLVPGHEAMASIEEDGNGVGGELLLRKQLSRVARPAQVVLMDCPPNLGRLSLAALASDEQVQLCVPVKCGPNELDGLARLLQTAEKVRANEVGDPQIALVVATMYDGRLLLDQSVTKYLADKFGGAYVDRPVRAATRVGSAKSHGLPLREYDPTATINGDYDHLGLTLVQRLLVAA
jgi:chromosome partitioning protein